MAATLRASEQGLEIVDQARKDKGWKATAIAWCIAAKTSVATLKRFRGRRPIQQDVFMAICKAVGIDNWEAIVDDSPTQEKSSYAVGRMINRVINDYHYSGKYTQAIAWYQDLLADS